MTHGVLQGRCKAWRAAGALLAVLLLGGCTTLDYYRQLTTGQLSLLAAREPVVDIITDPTRDPQLRQRLLLALQARAYASVRLGLPDNGSYRLYVALDRPYVMWNLFTTPEFSLEPITHCFPIAGCVAYRGYYQRESALSAAEEQRAQGRDAYVGGVPAYSTLGWFDDPIYSSMLRWSDDRLISTIFHELAHQRYYLPGDSAFNESYATFVEGQALRQWRADRGLPPPDLTADIQVRQFTRLILDTRERLAALYARNEPVAKMRAAKAAEFDELRRRYRALRDGPWQGQARFDAWMAEPMSNAKLLPFGLYDRWVPAFAELFRQQGGDWPAFFTAVERLGALSAPARAEALRRLDRAGAPPDAVQPASREAP